MIPMTDLVTNCYLKTKKQTYMSQTSNTLKGKELYEARKKWAEAMGVTFATALGKKVNILTGRFTTTAEGFDIHIVSVDSARADAYFEKENIEYSHTTNGDYTIIYPEYLCEEKINPKDKGKFLERERDRIVRTLSNKDFKTKGKGRNGSGSYTTNKYNAYSKSKMIEIYAINETAAKQISKIVEKHFQSSKGVEIALSEKTVKIKFHDEFFPKPEVKEDTNQQQPVATLKSDEQLLEEQIALEQAQKAMSELQLLKKTIFGVFGTEAGEKMLKLLTDKNFEIITTALEGPDGNQRKVTRTLNAGDINEMIIKPWITAMTL